MQSYESFEYAIRRRQEEVAQTVRASKPSRGGAERRPARARLARGAAVALRGLADMLDSPSPAIG